MAKCEDADRRATSGDNNAIWADHGARHRAGETYSLPRDMSEESALAYWLRPSARCSSREDNGDIVGTYCLQANQKGGGAHVAIVATMTRSATGRGVPERCARIRWTRAGARIRAMQFNFVISTNERAVRLWQIWALRLSASSGAFHHPTPCATSTA